MPIDALILAGAAAGPEMSPDDERLSRAMIRIGPKTMIQWIVDALRRAESIGRIIAVGDVAAEGLDEVIPPSGHYIENLMRGVEACGEAERILVLTSDIPLISPEAIDDFVGRSIASGGEMCYPFVARDACLVKYPKMKRTYLRTKEGMFTGGNMMVLSPAFIRRNEARISRSYEARKNPIALGWMIGPGTLLRLVAAQVLFPSLLPIPFLAKVMSKRLGGKVVGITSHYPEIGADVDKASDLEQVRELLA